jgi:Inner membrane protein YgaP-like, transmembrane domain
MNLDRAVVSFAGIMVLVSLVLAQYHSPYWLLLTAFVGLNLVQAGITGFCPAAMIFKKLGVRPGNAFQ